MIYMGQKLQRETRWNCQQEMGLFAGYSFNFYLIKAKNVAKPSFVFLSAVSVKAWNSSTVRTVHSSATGGECSYQRGLMLHKLRGIPCSVSGGFRCEHVVPISRYMVILKLLTRLHTDSVSQVSWKLVPLHQILNQFKSRGTYPYLHSGAHVVYMCTVRQSLQWKQ